MQKELIRTLVLLMLCAQVGCGLPARFMSEPDRQPSAGRVQAFRTASAVSHAAGSAGAARQTDAAMRDAAKSLRQASPSSQLSPSPFQPQPQPQPQTQPQPQPQPQPVANPAAQEIAISTLRVDVDATASAAEPVLLALARQAQVQLELRGVSTKLPPLTLSLRDQPLDAVLEVIGRQLGLEWQIEGGTLLVQGQEPWFERYPINYLALERRLESRIGLATEVGSISAGEAGATQGIENSSSTLIENAIELKFWSMLEQDLAVLLRGVESTVDYTLNPVAGLLGLRAPAEVHRRVREWLDALQGQATRQVLIEASVIEVVLSREHELGVDWQYLATTLGRGLTFGATQQFGGAAAVVPDAPRRVPEGALGIVQRDSQGEFQATLSLLERFGDVQIVSRPRILAMNNQPAVLKVVDNRVYFTMSVERTPREHGDEVATDTEIHTVPVGLVINVTPQIRDDHSVMLNVRPSLSRILGFVDDPSPELAAVGARNGVPEIQVREMESLLTLNPGEFAIIGGLMQDERQDNDRALPGLSALPGIGPLFRRESRTRRRSELLIMLTAKVV